MTLTPAQAAERWRAAKHLMARAVRQLAELDEETDGPQQHLACVLVTECAQLDRRVAEGVRRFADV